MRGTLALTIMFDLVVNSGKEAAEKSQTRRVISRVSAAGTRRPLGRGYQCGGEVRVSPREILGRCPCTASASLKGRACCCGAGRRAHSCSWSRLEARSRLVSPRTSLAPLTH